MHDHLCTAFLAASGDSRTWTYFPKFNGTIVGIVTIATLTNKHDHSLTLIGTVTGKVIGCVNIAILILKK